MKTYQVISPLRYKGKTIKSGLIQMPEAEAALLVKQTVLIEQLDNVAVSAEAKPVAPAKTARKATK